MNFIYHNQIVHHKPCFNLFLLHNNSFDNQGSEINNSDIFCMFRHTVFLLKTFFRSTLLFVPVHINYPQLYEVFWSFILSQLILNKNHYKKYSQIKN